MAVAATHCGERKPPGWGTRGAAGEAVQLEADVAAPLHERLQDEEAPEEADAGEDVEEGGLPHPLRQRDDLRGGGRGKKGGGGRLAPAALRHQRLACWPPSGMVRGGGPGLHRKA